MSRSARALLLAFSLLLLTAPAVAVAQADLDATIRRTAFGIPHITADSIAGIGYGYGYSFAQDNICVIADQYVTVRAERSRFFGPNEKYVLRGNGFTSNNLESDFFYKRINQTQVIEKLMAQPPPLGPRPEIKEGVRGYVEGYNRYLRETGVDNLPDPACRGKEWVKPIEEIDAYRRFYQLALLASQAVAINGIGGAQPPPPGDVRGGGGEVDANALITNFGERLPLGGIGSNAYGIGREQTDNGKGMLLGNPHFPWDGSERFYQAHLTIPGKLDVSGGSLYGVPLILIGHTRGLAWSHTVSTAFRFTPFELTLAPGSPTTYLVDGQPKEMQKDTVTIQAREADGKLTDRKRTLYSTQYGPIVNELSGIPLPWAQGKAYAMGDANAMNFRYLNHFYETNFAQTVREYDEVLRRNQGIPWVNSIAADATGEAYYADISVVPHVTEDKAQLCNTALGRATYQALRLPVLDGARSSCNWGTDPSAVAPGIFGPKEHLPSMFRNDYTMNANDSYWLSNLKQKLEGFPKIIGDEKTARSLRTRIGLLMIDGQKMTLQKLQDTVFNNRQYAGELWRDEALIACGRDASLADACKALREWNLRDDNDSRGALLWRRFAQRLIQSGPTAQPAPFEVPFNENDPANTPRGLREDDPRVLQALRDAKAELQRLEIPLDAPLAAVQTEDRPGGERIPIHGGPGTAGVFNAINVSAADLKPKTGYGTVPHGSSFVQAVQFVDGPCPVNPRTILTYSQSADPTSPWHSDQTRLFSRKEWVSPPFCAGDVERQAISTTSLRASNRDVVTGGCRPSSDLGGARAGVRGRRIELSVPAGATAEVVRGRKRIATVRGPARRLVAAGRAGTYLVRFRAGTELRRVAFARRGRRLRALPSFERRSPCGLITAASLLSPSVGRTVTVNVGLAARGTVSVRVTRRGRTVARSRSRRAAARHRLRIPGRRLRRSGTYRVIVTATSGRQRATTSLRAVRR